MEKNKINTQELLKRRRELGDRLTAIADDMKAKSREMTADEKVEREAITREMNQIDLYIQAATNPTTVQTQKSREVRFDEILREAKKGGSNKEFGLQREAVVTTDPNIDATFPVTVEALMEPLEEGLILDKLGIPTRTGLSGKFVIPGIGAITATVADEAVEISDTTIDWEKLTPNPKRLAISASISNQTINASNGTAYRDVVDQLRVGIQRALNLRMFTTRQSVSDGFVGPFKALAAAQAVPAAQVRTLAQKKTAKHIMFAGDVPTYKELQLLRAIPTVKGVRYLYGAYIMDAAMAAELRATPKGAGGGRMILEDGYIDGMPVYETNYLELGTNKSYIAFGFFGYEALGQFGDMRMIIDPYTEASKDCVKIVLNADWAMTTLRPEAFALGECPTGGGSGSGSGN